MRVVLGNLADLVNECYINIDAFHRYVVLDTLGGHAEGR